MAATNLCTIVNGQEKRKIVSGKSFMIEYGTASFNGVDVEDFLPTNISRVEAVFLTPVNAQGGEVIGWADAATLSPGIAFTTTGLGGLTITRAQGSTWNGTANVPNTPTSGLLFSYMIVGT